MQTLPAPFIARMTELLGKDVDAFLTAYDYPASIGLRVNTLKISPQQFCSISPYPLTPIPWTQDGFSLPADSRPGKHPYHAAGLYYIQDPSAMAVTELLNPQPGERIIDLAAAPGGKATHIAAKLEGRGILVANDIHPRRARVLCQNLERFGIRNAVVLNETPSRLAEHFGALFDGVLVDAPCSGEGMFRKDPAAVHEWTPRFVESCAFRQDGILHEAAALVRPGGRLVYATCTFAPEENEGTIFRFLKSHPDFKVGIPENHDAFSPGRPDWVSLGETTQAGTKLNQLSRTVRLWPHCASGEGHFIAVLRRNVGDIPIQRLVTCLEHPPLAGAFQMYFKAFAKSTLKWVPSENRLSMQGSYLYHLPEGLPELHGLRVVHWGWWLGTMKIKRFEPSYGMAMALQPEDVHQVLALTSNDSRTLAYLHGNVLPSPGPDGWVMVTIDDYPLGWGKRVHNRVKSHSPKWLRLI